MLKALTEQHIEEWVSVLPRDDLMSLSFTLHRLLTSVYGVKKTDAAESIGQLIGKNERTVYVNREKLSVTMQVASQTASKAIIRGKECFGKMRSSVRQHVTSSEKMLS